MLTDQVLTIGPKEVLGAIGVGATKTPIAIGVAAHPLIAAGLKNAATIGRSANQKIHLIINPNRNAARKIA